MNVCFMSFIVQNFVTWFYTNKVYLYDIFIITYCKLQKQG